MTKPGATGPEPRFWETTPLEKMTDSQWESLCDGCAKCCLEKLEDQDTGEIRHTNIACRLLDLGTCRCSDYDRRAVRVPDCVQLTPRNVAELKWMPSTCAYRLLSEGKSLPDWHPLISGDAESVHEAGQSVRGRVVSDNGRRNWKHHLVDWPA